jgi:hypothetical protein
MPEQGSGLTVAVNWSNWLTLISTSNRLIHTKERGRKVETKESTNSKDVDVFNVRL